jgi:D-tyrosyl-tRNA(Tyr) deacylase
MVTTTRKEDFLGRNLTNATPGTSNATDHLGRNVVASNKDFLGRNLTVVPWAAATAYTAGSLVYLAGGQELECTVAGTSHATTPPTAPAVGATVTDNTITWRRTE